MLTNQEIKSGSWLSLIFEKENPGFPTSQEIEEYKNLSSLMLGSHHAQITGESFLEYSFDENITETADRIGNLISYAICFMCYIIYFLIIYISSIFLVNGAKLHEAATAMPPEKEVKFKTLRTRSLGHAASILFWNDQQVGITNTQLQLLKHIISS